MPDIAGRMIAMFRTSPLVWDRGELYAGGWHIATYTWGTTHFNHADWLGNVRVRTNPAGAISNSYSNLPFGDCLTELSGAPCNGSVGSTPAHFTDQDRDDESELDHFLFRQYSSVQGRWMSPDPASLAAVDPTNPQTWNRYAYVGNDPIGLVDPLGLCPAPGVYSKKCVYVERIGPGASGCSIDGVSTDCGLALSRIQSGAAYPSSTSVGDCYQERSGTVFCGGTGEDRHRFDPTNYLSSLPPSLASQLEAYQNYSTGEASLTPANPCAVAGRAPAPSAYAQTAQKASSNAFSEILSLLQFRRGAALDAQVRYGGAPSYANYAYGVYMSAAGNTLPQALALADTYAQFRSHYPVGTTMAGPEYPYLPQANVTNIINGYVSQQTGTICEK
jgi:RHS repeat-associated protein